MVPPRWARRLLMPLVISFELVLLALMVPTALIGLLGAVVDRRARLLRLAAMAASYVVIEVVAIFLFLGLWAARPLLGKKRWDRANLRLLAWALGRVLGAARRTVGLVMSLQEPPAGSGSLSLLAGEEPVLVLARHGGIGDSFALVWLLAERYHRRPRIVLKRMLLWEPLIDVALTRMEACFLPPAGRGGAGRDGRVAAICASLRPGDALLLFPEGGNWTPRRRLKAMARLWTARRPEAVKAAALLEHVLPPRTGGVLACLEARPEVPVLTVAHTGLDRITTARELWRALPFSTPMSVRWWAAPPAPSGEEGRVAWLTAEWAVVDQWIDARQAQERA